MSKSLLLSLVLSASLVTAQEKTGPQSFGEHLGPHAPTATVIPLDWGVQADLAQRHAASLPWRTAHPGWTIAFDPRTKMPWRAFGPGIPVAPENASHDEIVTAVEALKGELAIAAGLDPADFAFVTAAKAGQIWYVDFAQVIAAAPVFNGGLTLRIDDHGLLVMWGGRLVDPSRVADGPRIESDRAVAETLGFLGRERFLNQDTRFERPDVRLVVHVADGRDRLAPTLAWLIEMRTSSPAAWWKVFIDATNGSVLESWNDIREHGHDHGDDDHGAACAEPRIERSLFMIPLLASFSGISTGTVHDGVSPQAPPVLRSFNDLYVNCNGLPVVTDALGAYAFNGGPASVSVTSGLEGIHVTTNNSGPEASFVGMGSTGTLDVVWDDVNSSLAERDAFFFTNQAWNNLMLRNPAETLFGAALQANVNLAQTCNAYYDGASINFFVAGGSCINTAYSASVVIHEYGHHVTIVIYASHGKNIPGGMGEGYADCQSGAVLGTNIIGDGFQGPGTMVRNMDNTCQYPASCGTEVHQAGLIIGACYWHTRTLFANAYGAAGTVMMDEYLYKHFHGSPQNEVEACMEMLLLNDNDGNLSNGTPDAGKFHQGFSIQHSVPFPIPLVAITHDSLRDTADQLQSYQIRATGSPLLGGAIAGATTKYSINGGAYVSTPMGNLGGGSDYVASIPVQPPGTTIDYYIEFQDSLANVGRLPAGGASAPLTFRTFRLAQFFFDGFEAPSGWTSATQAGANDWHNQAPGNPSHAYDPATAYEGTKCWGNDLTPASNWNGNYPNNVLNHLTSPTINCTGKTGVSLVYRRWLTVEDGLFDHARIKVSNNGGSAFTTVWENAAGSGSQHHVDTGWVEHAVNIAAFADNQANVMIRFEMQSDAGLALGGWNIDALSLASASAGLPLTQIGSSAPFGVTTIRMAGIPGEAAVLVLDLATSPTYYATVGTLSMNAASQSLLIVYNGAQTIPPSGLLDLTFLVPPASGITAYFQGVLIPPVWEQLLITNVLTFTIL